MRRWASGSLLTTTDRVTFGGHYDAAELQLTAGATGMMLSTSHRACL
ncbi:MAG: hypothetical protein OES26_09380 [Gammaproteobacteria bacterium]|nr:hypothetical protein [Gammaproteobacteria bacterium]